MWMSHKNQMEVARRKNFAQEKQEGKEYFMHSTLH
jgi:hypothetical protein